jgi:hypothetical protein
VSKEFWPISPDGIFPEKFEKDVDLASLLLDISIESWQNNRVLIPDLNPDHDGP